MVNLLPTMNSRDRVDNNAFNISWHIIMKARISIIAFDQDENEIRNKFNRCTGINVLVSSYP